MERFVIVYYTRDGKPVGESPDLVSYPSETTIKEYVPEVYAYKVHYAKVEKRIYL